MGFERDGIKFNIQDEGAGVPFLFLHGLGGDVSQPFGFFRGLHAGIRIVSLDFRAHGKTRPLGPEDKISMAAFADDVIAFMDYARIPQAVIGGISMGAAVALNIALRYPTRATALILQRPAWLDKPMPEHLKVLVQIGELIRAHGAAKAIGVFRQTPEYDALARISPDVAASTLTQFTQPRADETHIKLLRIPNDAPCSDRAWKSLKVPTLVLATRIDPIHPYEYGVTLGKEIPGAKFQEVTSKAVSVERHTVEVRAQIEDFIHRLS